MEECEALCSRLAIMVNGSLQCLGTAQHLKHKYGSGYTLIIRVGKAAKIGEVASFVSSALPSASLVESRHNLLQYQLHNAESSLSGLFRAMEVAKERKLVEDFSVAQTTLDQVFINFARSQKDLQDSPLDGQNRLNSGGEFSEAIGGDTNGAWGRTNDLLHSSSHPNVQSNHERSDNKDVFSIYGHQHVGDSNTSANRTLYSTGDVFPGTGDSSRGIHRDNLGVRNSGFIHNDQTTVDSMQISMNQDLHIVDSSSNSTQRDWVQFEDDQVV